MIGDMLNDGSIAVMSFAAGFFFGAILVLLLAGRERRR